MSDEFQDSQLKKYKTIIIGRSAVGKSTLLLRYVDGQFNPQKPTIGIDYRFKPVSYNNTQFHLELWDSAGQQRYRTIVYNYFTLSKAACIVFDLTNEDSLTDAKTWLQQLVLHCGNEIPKLLLGNKSDLLTPVKLAQQLEHYKPKIDELKKEYNCQFFAVSALTGEGVNEAFDHLIKQIYERNKVNSTPEPKKGIPLSQMKKENKKQTNDKKKCC